MSNIVPGFPGHISIPKDQARRLATALKGRLELGHAQSLELVARLHGQQSWGHMRAILDRGTLAADPPAQNCAPSGTSRAELALHDLTLNDIMDVYRADEEKHQKLALVEGLTKAAMDVTNKPPHRIDGSENFGSITCEDLMALIGKNHTSLPENACLHEPLAAALKARLDDLMVLQQRPRRNIDASSVEAGIALAGLKNWEDHQSDQQLIDRRHGWLFTTNLQRFTVEMEDQGQQVIDLSIANEVGRLARLADTEIPQCLSSVVACKLIIGRYIGALLDGSDITGGASMLSRKWRRPRVAILSAREVLMMQGTDVLLAQARSMGFHILVHWDLDLGDLDGFDKIEGVVRLKANLARSIWHAPDVALRWSGAPFPETSPKRRGLHRLFG